MTEREKYQKPLQRVLAEIEKAREQERLLLKRRAKRAKVRRQKSTAGKRPWHKQQKGGQ